MTVKTSYQPGEPIWSDLSSPDVPASVAFYSAVFGWTATEPQQEFGGYASFLLDGRAVAGLMPLMSPEQPPSWTCYLCTDDADKTAALVEQAGGTTIAPPMDVAGLGRMAVFADPHGAVFGVWQPGTHLGSEVVSEVGSQSWLELTAESPKDVPDFYSNVFGWEARVSDDYVELLLNGTAIAGVTDPSQATSGWLPYFAVADPGASADQAQELGATLVLPLTTFPGGSCVIIRDPHGATLGLITSQA